MWHQLLTHTFIIGVLAAGIRLATPILLAVLGEIFSERAGVLKISLEGEMLIGALAGFLGAYYCKHLWIGFCFGMLAALMYSGIAGFFSITLKVDQVITGITLNLLALGLTSFLYRLMLGQSFIPPSITPLVPLKIPGLCDVPFLGSILFSQNLIVYLTFFFLTPVSAFVLFKTPFGLNLRAVGEYPLAADTVGIRVIATRYICVMIGGMFSGLGGAFMTLAQLNMFTENLIAGRGFIALAAVIFGRWHPFGAVIATLLFGVADALQLRLQAIGVTIPYQFLLMLPYVLTILALIGVVRRTTPPSALAVPYERLS
ncbi:sugar ABC transporter, permease protein [Candidatus Moduliflexus flocculans]|uniref:Sugar ABC transporter, permease protein n=1 Tax=Candidatus Moduliflexus flocculans TaxID=1499966 RepID=A0A0S6VUF4_9BACT|nr:sugar ABC transporter, permease protein [Candidatus Moduliflexus flocculans]